MTDLVDFYMFYNDEQRKLTNTLLDKFIIIIEDTMLREMFVKNASLTIKDSLLALREKHLHGTEWKDSWKYFYSDIHSRKKERWKSKAFRDLKQKKLKNAKELFRLYEEYSEVYSEDEVERKLIEPKKDVLNWAELPNSYLHQYPFFEEKTPNARSKALEDDLALTFLSFLKNEWDEDSRSKGKEVTEIPYDNQLVYSNYVHRKPMEFDGVIEQDGEETPYKDVGLTESPLRIMVENSPEANNMAKSFDLDLDIYDLDQIDRDIMTAVLEHRKENFAIDKTIEVRLGDLVRDVFESDGKKNYDSVLSRLIKLQRIRFTHITPEEVNGVITGNVRSREHMGFIEYINEITTEQGEVYLSIVINQGIHKRFINNQTLKIYREQIYLLDSSYRSMLYYMQKERIKSYRLGKTQIDLTLTNFMSNIQFRYSSKRKIREEIMEALDKIIEKNIIVRDYSAGNDIFSIEFEPINQQEVRDIIGEKNDRIDLQQLLPTQDAAGDFPL